MKLRRLLLMIVTALSAALPAASAGRFAWGADVGTSIDVSGNDMSTLNLDAFLGYRTAAIDIVGVGAGINMMVGNSCRAFPLYAMVRTSFRTAPSLCFMDLRCGCVLDNLSDDSMQTAFYISPAIGFNLALSKSFRSYITVGYTFNGMRSFGSEPQITEIGHGLHMVTARFGVTF